MKCNIYIFNIFRKIDEFEAKEYELLSTKKEYTLLRKRYDEVMNRYSQLEYTLKEKDNYLKNLEQDYDELKNTFDNTNTNNNIIENTTKLIQTKNNFHEIKLAVHSCLSVAQIFIQKYNDINRNNYNNNNNPNSNTTNYDMSGYNNSLCFGYPTSLLSSTSHLINIDKENNLENERYLVKSLRDLEEWINIMCNELEVKYLNIILII
jgi:chromosome segregation ATPase